MKQGRIAMAYKTIISLYKKPGLPFRICNQLFMLKKVLEPFYEFQADMEGKVIEESGQEINRFEMTPEIRKAFEQIQAEEVEIEIEPLEIPLTDDLAEKMGITGEMIDQLDGFIKFTEAGA